MREITFYYPLADNSGIPMHGHVNPAVTELALMAGGATYQDVRGIWYSTEGQSVRYEEECRRVTLTIDPDEQENFRSSVEIDLRMYGQLAMYWVDCNGEAHCDDLS